MEANPIFHPSFPYFVLSMGLYKPMAWCLMIHGFHGSKSRASQISGLQVAEQLGAPAARDEASPGSPCFLVGGLNPSEKYESQVG